MNGRLYVVATPIGNLKDITIRALEILKSVKYIACEDTRNTRKLLSFFGISGKKLISYHDYNEEKIAPRVLKILENEDVALVSDAGTPCISDPGYNLVKLCREKNIQVVPIPGAFAGAAALSVSGVPSDKFLFVGFLPSKENQRKKKILEYMDLGYTFIVYESPNRILKTLSDVYLADQDAMIFLAKEITKIHERFFYGRVSEIIQALEEDKDILKGEFVIVIVPQGNREVLIDFDEEIKRMLLQGFSTKDITNYISDKYNVSKKNVYKKVMQIRGEL